MPTSQGGTSGSLNLAVGIAAQSEQSAEIISASLLQFACKGGFGSPRAPILHSQVTNLSKTSPPGLLREGVSCFHCELQNLPLRPVGRSPSPIPFPSTLRAFPTDVAVFAARCCRAGTALSVGKHQLRPFPSCFHLLGFDVG